MRANLAIRIGIAGRQNEIREFAIGRYLKAFGDDGINILPLAHGGVEGDVGDGVFKHVVEQGGGEGGLSCPIHIDTSFNPSQLFRH